MTEYTYLVIILGTRFFQHYFNKKTSSLVSGADKYLSYGAYRYILSALLALALLFAKPGSGAQISLPALLCSALAAAALALSLYFSLEAMKSGAIVLVSLASSAGLILPCVLGIFMFDEPMSVWQLAGIAVLIFSAYLLGGYSRDLHGSLNLRTVGLLLGSMMTNGTVMIAQKMYSLYIPGGNVSVFSLLTFGIAGLMFVLPLGVRAIKAKNIGIVKLPAKLLGYGVALSVILLLINQLSTIAAAKIPSAILFPVNDGGSTIISAIVAAVFFGEKLTLRSTIGILLGILSLVVINLL